ncbi:unnamed protein product [Effrenium voratum]|uniref:Uncharacterized protein n=1 Tax=Effrenium voratum TaxID=2562239 RepID=A0AA36JIJ0_9DINO|nr:unnamed protein product [Effrenium voratum]
MRSENQADSEVSASAPGVEDAQKEMSQQKELEAKEAKPTDSSRVFAIGEKVRYWSGTHAKWVDAHVQRINLGPAGDLISYDLSAKAQAEISRVKDASTPEDAPPPVRPLPPAVPPVERVVTLAPVEVEKFDQDAEVQYFSESRERWIDAVVSRR